jgi:predicted signal transduction protein with EAL and GGDEF domain
VSIGAALYPDCGTDIAALRKRSDLALYEAKRSGRNCAIFSIQDSGVANGQAASLETGHSGEGDRNTGTGGDDALAWL